MYLLFSKCNANISKYKPEELITEISLTLALSPLDATLWESINKKV